MSISSQDLIVFFASFGVALVALNLYKLSQPEPGDTRGLRPQARG